ncbi:hypothetical protein LTR85_011885 [Meristemomyces frigidus]|nr:hypothetical protein LTR85_011885 [Meristemomyces frigidus]
MLSDIDSMADDATYSVERIPFDDVGINPADLIGRHLRLQYPAEGFTMLIPLRLPRQHYRESFYIIRYPGSNDKAYAGGHKKPLSYVEFALSGRPRCAHNETEEQSDVEDEDSDGEDSDGEDSDGDDSDGEDSDEEDSDGENTNEEDSDGEHTLVYVMALHAYERRVPSVEVRGGGKDPGDAHNDSGAGQQEVTSAESDEDDDRYHGSERDRVDFHFDATLKSVLDTPSRAFRKARSVRVEDAAIGRRALISSTGQGVGAAQSTRVIGLRLKGMTQMAWMWCDGKGEAAEAGYGLSMTDRVLWQRRRD